jgi:hypothetical protein
MTASRLRPSRPTDKWQHRLSSRTPTGTEPASRQLPKSANRNTVESNNVKNNNKSKEQNLDTGDLLIESRLLGQAARKPDGGFLPSKRMIKDAIANNARSGISEPQQRLQNACVRGSRARMQRLDEEFHPWKKLRSGVSLRDRTDLRPISVSTRATPALRPAGSLLVGKSDCTAPW